MGVATVVAVAVADSPVAGVHENELAPEAVMLSPLPPEHTLPPAGVTVIAGSGLTLTRAPLDVLDRPETLQVVMQW